MDSNEIIKCLEDFFRTADEEALAEVNAAFSAEIEGDVSLEEYLSGFNREYIYANSSSSNRNNISNKHLIPSTQYQYSRK